MTGNILNKVFFLLGIFYIASLVFSVFSSDVDPVSETLETVSQLKEPELIFNDFAGQRLVAIPLATMLSDSTGSHTTLDDIWLIGSIVEDIMNSETLRSGVFEGIAYHFSFPVWLLYAGVSVVVVLFFFTAFFEGKMWYMLLLVVIAYIAVSHYMPTINFVPTDYVERTQ